jgi:hypothetical protein
VGSDSRQHPFVDEGLAQYSAMLYMEDRYGAERARREADLQVGMNYQVMRLLGHADAPVDRPVAAFTAPIAYAGLVYGKGPFVYRELRRAVGDAAFFNALRTYVARYRFRVAPARGLVDLLATGTHAPRVQAIARRWLDETHGDEDLGRADLGAMLGTMLGGEAGALGSQRAPMLEMLGGAGALGGSRTAPGVSAGTPPAGSSGTPPAMPDLRELMQQMQQLEQLLDTESR